MKITFEKQNLSKALDTVQRAAQNKITSNTNNGIYISALNGQIEFQANDYSIGIKTICEGKIEEEGSVVILSHFLPEMIKRLPEGIVTIEQKKNENTVQITCGKTINKFLTKNIDDFPMLQEMDHQNHFFIDSQTLKDMTALTQFAASTDKQKPFFTGILFEVEKTRFSMAATNTHRLAAKDFTLEKEASANGRMIVPSGIMSDVTRLLPSEDPVSVEISWARSHIAFTFGSVYFISTLISGEYPDYHRVIPDHFDSTVVLDRRLFTEAIGRASLLSRDVSYNTINFSFKDDAVDISVEDKDVGAINETVPASLTGDDVEIVFNCFYIEDILKHSAGNTNTLHLLKNGPMLVEQENDPSYSYVVTPMRGH